VEKRALLTIAFVALLMLSAVTGMHFINSATANPVEAYTYTAPPIVTPYSPANNETLSPNVLLNFTITRPDHGWLISFKKSTSEEFKNVLISVDIMLDGELYRSIEANSYLSSPFGYFENLTNLTGGAHSVAIQTDCVGWDLELHGFWERKLPYEASSDSINFTVDATFPAIAVFSVENKTYRTSEVALDFAVNEVVSQISYVLDGQENVTISGNTTLTGLTDGLHSVTVYAKDLVGNTGVSETIYFSVDMPFPTTIVIASAIPVAIIGVGLLVYFKKRKKSISNSLRVSAFI
jgi:hypothetical protein